LVLRFVTSVYKFFRDKGAAHLILFAKFIPTAGTYYRDS